MARAAAIPKHYSLTITTNEAFSTIVALRAMERDRDVMEGDPVLLVLRALEEAYEGDLPEPPGTPILEPVEA